MFSLAIGVLLAAIVFGFKTRTPPPYPYGPSGQLVKRAGSDGDEYVGGGPLWAVFERGVVLGDGTLIKEQGREETVGGVRGHNYSFKLPSPLETH